MTDILETTWLQDLKAGDTVIVAGTDFHGNRTVGTVARVTPTQIIVGEERYSRETGRQRGDVVGWQRGWLLEATPERLAACRHAELVATIGTAAARGNLEKQPTATLEQVAALLAAKASETIS